MLKDRPKLLLLICVAIIATGAIAGVVISAVRDAHRTPARPETTLAADIEQLADITAYNDGCSRTDTPETCTTGYDQIDRLVETIRHKAGDKYSYVGYDTWRTEYDNSDCSDPDQAQYSDCVYVANLVQVAAKRLVREMRGS